jgi:hypothetical protein
METTRDLSMKNPSWWNDKHSSGWERTKEALRRDWEQTKADFTDGGQELNQDVGDTIKQAAGKEAIPPAGIPNAPELTATSSTRRNDWGSVEPAMRYGYGARHHYSDVDWSDDLELRLRRDWDETSSGSTWEQVKGAVRRGWESVKRVAD